MDYTKGIKLFPRTEIYHCRGLLLLQQRGNTTNAIEDGKPRAIFLNPNFALAYYITRGLAHAKRTLR